MSAAPTQTAADRVRVRLARWLALSGLEGGGTRVTQAEVAARMLVQQETVSKWKAGKHDLPLARLDALAAVMQTTPEALVAPLGASTLDTLAPPSLPLPVPDVFAGPMTEAGGDVPDNPKQRLLHLVASLDSMQCATLINPLRRLILTLPDARESDTEGDAPGRH